MTAAPSAPIICAYEKVGFRRVYSEEGKLMERQRRRVIAKAKLETGKTTPSPVVAEFRPRGDGSPPPDPPFG